MSVFWSTSSFGIMANGYLQGNLGMFYQENHTNGLHIKRVYNGAITSCPQCVHRFVDSFVVCSCIHTNMCQARQFWRGRAILGPLATSSGEWRYLRAQQQRGYIFRSEVPILVYTLLMLKPVIHFILKSALRISLNAKPFIRSLRISY